MLNKFLDRFRAEENRDKGIKKAIDHAEVVEPNWSETAYEFLLEFVEDQKGSTFMAEDVRMSSVGSVPTPPSNRAWGGVMRRAAFANVIERDGYRETKNKKAHRTPATLWIQADLPF